MLNGTSDEHQGQTSELKNVIREVMAEFMQDERWLPKVSDGISANEKRILDAMSWLERETGKVAFKPEIVAYFSKNAPESQGFGDAHRALRRKGMITRVYGGYFQLSTEGRKLATPRNAVLHQPKQESTDPVS